MRNQNNSGNVASDGAAILPRRRYKNGGHMGGDIHYHTATIGSAVAQLKPTDMEPIHQSQNDGQFQFETRNSCAVAGHASSQAKPNLVVHDHLLSVVH